MSPWSLLLLLYVHLLSVGIIPTACINSNKFVGPHPSVEREFSQSKPAQKRTTLHDSDSTTVEILSSHFS